jgi:hypothetical protein
VKITAGLHYVYFIRELGSHYVKIGYSNDPESRLRDLQTGNPHTLELTHLIQLTDLSAARRIEKTFHDRYARSRTQGEWYILSENDLADVRLATEIANEAAKAERIVWHNRVRSIYAHWERGEWLPDQILGEPPAFAA